MSQLAGWRFLELGRRIERAIATCRFVRQFAFAPSPTARSTCCWSSPTARSPIGCATSWWRRRRRSSISWCSTPTIRARSPTSWPASRRISPPCRKRNDDSRLSPPEQIATALATQIRTADAAALDDATFLGAGTVADEAVGRHRRRPTSPRTSAPRFAGRRSDDLRRPPDHDLSLRIPGRLCAPCAAADADRPLRTSASMPPRSTSTPAPIERREGQRFLRQPDDLDRARSAARHAERAGRGARHGRAATVAPAAARPRRGKRCATAAFASVDLSPHSPAHFLFPSRQVSLDPEIRDYAAESFPPGRPVLAGAIDLMQRIKADFVYEIGATTASTTPPMSFALRRGVCQDFAHIMISGMRGARPAGGLCQRLSAHRAVAGRDAARRRRRHACLGAGVVRRGGRLARARSDQRALSPATTTSCSRSAATTPTSRRSTASSSRRADSG